MAWDISSRAKIVEYFFTMGSIVTARREFRKACKCRNAPDGRSIKRWVARFRKDGTVGDVARRRIRPVRKPSNIKRVARAVNSAVPYSTRRLSSRTKIHRRSVQRILREDLGLFPYKIQLAQKLRRGDKSRRLEFSQWFVRKTEYNPKFVQNLFMSDEAEFHLDGSVNKQNCRYWSAENPYVVEERDTYSPHVNVWCAVSTKGIIGPYFFEDQTGTLTVNADRYCAMISSFFVPNLHQQNVSMRTAWLQQDGATAHTSKKTIQLLNKTFKKRFISKHGPVAWPPRSPDLTVPDFFLWGFVKSQVYATPVHSIAQLKRRIRSCINSIPLQTLKKVMEALPARCKECIKRRGGHLGNILFHH